MSTEPNPKHEAVLRKAAVAIRARGHEGDARLADSVDGIIASFFRRASPAAAVPDGALPPLPEPAFTRGGSYGVMLINSYDASQMQAYARAAVEADRAQRPEHCRWPTCESEAKQEEIAAQAYRELYSGEGGADRAQQGEPVAVEKINMAQAGVGERARGYCAGWNDCVDEFSRAATKAAAPDDAPKASPYGYVNFETLDYVVGFGGDRVPGGYYPITILTNIRAPAEDAREQVPDEMKWMAANGYEGKSVHFALVDLHNKARQRESDRAGLPADCREIGGDIPVIISQSTADYALDAMKRQAEAGRYKFTPADDASFVRAGMRELENAIAIRRAAGSEKAQAGEDA